jgi:hypothetical protein
VAQASRNHAHTAEFSQREIENDNHLYLFQGVNPWIRNVDLYEVPLTHPPRNRFLREEEDTVTIDTSYPRSLRTYFGTPKLYTHINKDPTQDYTTDLYALEWGMDLPQCNEEQLKTSLTQKPLLGQVNEWVEVPWTLTQAYQDAVGEPRYSITVYDLITLSSALHQMGLHIGFALYTNRYTTRDTTYELYLAIGPELLPETPEAEESESKDIQMVCVYQDHPNPLKNIVFAHNTRSPSLKELRTNPAFEKALHRDYAHVPKLEPTRE